MSTTGEFFAVGRPQWGQACDIGLNPAVAMLVLARGTGRDNATTSWSAEAVSRYGGISWRRAKAAIDELSLAKLVKPIGTKTKPKYKIRKPKTADDLIWIPNTIVTGIGKEIPPLARLRQTREVELLQTFIEFYGEHDLAGDGGLPRSMLYQLFDRQKIMDMGQYVVFGFNCQESKWCRHVGPMEKYDKYKKPKGGDAKSWDHIGIMERLGLIEWVTYLTEESESDAELIHALSGDDHAEEAAAATIAITETLPDGYRQEAELYEWVLPILRHMEHGSLVQIARLRYRPRTSMTAAWYARHVEACREYAETYRRIASGDLRRSA